MTQPSASFAALDDDRLLSEEEVAQRVPMHRSTRYRKVRDGTFPAPIWISANRRVWRLSAIVAWIAEREKHPLRPRAYFGKTQPATPAEPTNQLVSSRRAAKAVTK